MNTRVVGRTSPDYFTAPFFDPFRIHRSQPRLTGWIGSVSPNLFRIAFVRDDLRRFKVPARSGKPRFFQRIQIPVIESPHCFSVFVHL